MAWRLKACQHPHCGGDLWLDLERGEYVCILCSRSVPVPPAKQHARLRRCDWCHVVVRDVFTVQTASGLAHYCLDCVIEAEQATEASTPGVA